MVLGGGSMGLHVGGKWWAMAAACLAAIFGPAGEAVWAEVECRFLGLSIVRWFVLCRAAGQRERRGTSHHFPTSSVVPVGFFLWKEV